MRKCSLALLVVVLVLGLGLHHAYGLSKLEEKRIREGIKAAQAVAGIMKGLEAIKWVSKIGSAVGPLLSVVTLALDIAMLFIKIPSPEMIKMKAEFKNINNKLDKFSVQFGEVKRKIKWSAIQLAYAKFERNIRVLNQRRLALAQQKDKSTFELDKQRFIKEYNSGWEEASSKLYLAMTAKSVMTNNIFQAARIYTENHEKMAFEFIKGSIQLLMQAYSVDIAIVKLKYPNNTDVINYYKSDIEKKMIKVQASAMEVSKYIRAHWHQQMQIDVKKQSTKVQGANNHDFSRYMYHYLAGKYPWREWFVLAWRTHGNANDYRKQASHTCAGVQNINHANRNTVVASVEKSARTAFSIGWAQNVINSIGSFRVHNNYGLHLLNRMMRHNDGTRCSPAAVMATIRRKDHRNFDADAWIYTNKRRLKWQQSCAPYKCNTGLCWVKKQKCFAAILWG